MFTLEGVEIISGHFSKEESFLRILRGAFFPYFLSALSVSGRALAPCMQKPERQLGPRQNACLSGRWAPRQPSPSILPFHSFLYACFIFLLFSAG